MVVGHNFLGPEGKPIVLSADSVARFEDKSG